MNGGWIATIRGGRGCGVMMVLLFVLLVLPFVDVLKVGGTVDPLTCRA